MQSHRPSDAAINPFELSALAKMVIQSDGPLLLAETEVVLRNLVDLTGRLKPDERIVLKLKYWIGLDLNEIAQALRIPLIEAEAMLAAGTEKLAGFFVKSTQHVGN